MQLVSSVHALSYFLKTTTVVDKTVQDFAHRAEGEGWREGGVRWVWGGDVNELE